MDICLHNPYPVLDSSRAFINIYCINGIKWMSEVGNINFLSLIWDKQILCGKRSVCGPSSLLFLISSQTDVYPHFRNKEIHPSQSKSQT